MSAAAQQCFLRTPWCWLCARSPGGRRAPIPAVCCSSWLLSPLLAPKSLLVRAPGNEKPSQNTPLLCWCSLSSGAPERARAPAAAGTTCLGHAQAQYFIPILGMLLGNAISGVSVGLSTLLEELATGVAAQLRPCQLHAQAVLAGALMLTELVEVAQGVCSRAAGMLGVVHDALDSST